MKSPLARHFIILSMLIIMSVALWLTLRPQPMIVDLAPVTRGPMSLQIKDEGYARIRDVYTVSAPVAGHLLRIPHRPGDYVVANQTVLTQIYPNDPLLLDERSRDQAEASVRGASAALDLANIETQRIQAELEFATAQYQRAKTLAARNELSDSELDQLRLAWRAAQANLKAAEAAQQMRAAELSNARAVLKPSHRGDSQAVLSLQAPINGRVLQVFEQSETVVQAGQPLMSLGDPTHMEVVTDLLSSDAVKLPEQSEVELTGWGGTDTLRGKLRTVEPYGFTKLSALGVEEQRVNAIIDITSPPELWQGLQHGYRLDVALIYWQEVNVLRAPASALFRQDGRWHAFVHRQGRAQAVQLDVGEVNARWAQIHNGLEAGDEVVIYPAEGLHDQGLIQTRH